LSTLYVVASPIGNLGDISPRATEALRAAQHIVAEDTRRSRQLLSYLGISAKSIRCLNAHASEATLQRTIESLERGEVVALLTDAGTPGVSDPGAALVRKCHERALKVVPIPGASALTAAIAAAGLVDGPFLFLGFLPRSGSKRRQWLARIHATEEAVILFEAPNRVNQTLRDLSAGNDQRQLCIARELTKKFEQIETRALAAWLDDSKEWRGEVTMVLGPSAAPEAEVDLEQLDELLRAELSRGVPARSIAEQHHAAAGLSRRDLYQRLLGLKNANITDT
jgi:16S rRNA (cytidine1402-2'-O)-methyltransferase